MLDSQSDRQHAGNRLSNLELLRIIAMVMIVFHHFACHSGFAWDKSTVTIPHLWRNFIVMGGKIGVDIFVLISGYFLIKDEGKLFHLQRILKFWGQVGFYSIGISLVFMPFQVQEYRALTLINALLPITSSAWWFASTYFVLYILHPFLNRLLVGLNRKAYQSLLVTLIIMWSVIPTFTTASFKGSPFCWFVTLYALAGYVRLYGLNEKFTSAIYFKLWAAFSIFTYCLSVVCAFLATKWEKLSSYETYFFEMDTLTGLLISLTLFMAFATMKMNYHKWINVIASSTFGVYLIHENGIVRPFLWETVFKGVQYQDSLLLIPYSIFAVALVYVACTVLELIRQKVFEKPFLWLITRVTEIVLKPIVGVCEFIKRMVFG